jgi:hypothetical protein
LLLADNKERRNNLVLHLFYNTDEYKINSNRDVREFLYEKKRQIIFDEDEMSVQSEILKSGTNVPKNQIRKKRNQPPITPC